MRRPGVFVGLLVLPLAGCGYHLVHDAGMREGGPFVVTGSVSRAPSASLAAAVEEGARAELARSKMLAGAGAAAAIEVELIRVDETSEGIAVGSGGAPLARAVRVTAVGRAAVRRPGGAPAEHQTGEVQASEVAARAGSVGGAVVTAEEAGRIAARRLGEALVRRVLGLPQPDEP